MRLRLERPLVIFDVETTGTHPQVDRVVQIGVIKLHPNGQRTEWETLINPGGPIPPEVTAIHGVSDEMVADAPTFREVAPRLAGGLMGCDLGGYNVAFDIRFLRAEFNRVGGYSVLDGSKVVDAFRIFRVKEPRDLSAALKFYCDKDHIRKHSAIADAQATVDVLLAQLERYPDLPDNVEELHRIFFEKPADGHLDEDGKLAWRHREATINFGKHATVPLRKVDRSYLQWMVNKGEFSETVKRIVRSALEGNYPRSD